MAVTAFFMTDKEGMEFVSFLIDEFSAEFIPEKSNEPPPFPRYKELAEVRDRITRDVHYSRFFVLSPQWERYPLETSEVNANDGSYFFTVNQRNGGPAFDFVLSRTIERDGLKWMLPGSFSDYPNYMRDYSLGLDASECETFDRPESMKQAYKSVQKYLRRNGCRSICTEDGRAGPWVLNEAEAEFRLGIWLRTGKWHFEPRTKKR